MYQIALNRGLARIRASIVELESDEAAQDLAGRLVTREAVSAADPIGLHAIVARVEGDRSDWLGAWHWVDGGLQWQA